MKRTFLKMAAVGGVAVAVVATSVSSASAATGSLTVTTLGRNGAKVATTVNVVNLSTLDSRSVASGKALALPVGHYAALTDIYNPAGGTDTLGASMVTVSGATSITMDARSGHALSVIWTRTPVPATPRITTSASAPTTSPSEMSRHLGPQGMST